MNYGDAQPSVARHSRDTSDPYERSDALGRGILLHRRADKRAPTRSDHYEPACSFLPQTAGE
jgi:hypothetical protein